MISNMTKFLIIVRYELYNVTYLLNTHICIYINISSNMLSNAKLQETLRRSTQYSMVIFNNLFAYFGSCLVAFFYSPTFIYLFV